jgi:hypothetical protein
VLFPEMAGNPGFGVIRVVFRCLVRGSFAFVSLILTCRVLPRLFIIAFTTAAFRPKQPMAV